jgi:large subunit ribosomal protein L16
VFVRFLRHGGKLWIRVFPDKVVTKKPAETRMGGGKGAPEEWVAVVKRGRIMFELAGIGEEAAKKAIHLASYKLPIGTSLVAREVSDVEI